MCLDLSMQISTASLYGGGFLDRVVHRLMRGAQIYQPASLDLYLN